MSYCLNPGCPHPQNLKPFERCQACGALLTLRQRYRALKAIGRGGFGRTFLAVDEADALKRRCVIKQFLLPESVSETTRSTERFREEARRLAELGQHPQIPALLAAGTQAGQHYLIQEFMDGRTLAQELVTEGPFDEPAIRELLESLLPVLQFVHDRQVIHRDIKPANLIRRTSDQQLVLVDFGAAKPVTGRVLAETGTVIGSPEFVAPEQTRGKAVFASDLYSLGATCIHLLTGISPFELWDCASDRWVWREYLQTPLSSGLGQVIDRLLEQSINRRYQSAIAVQADLAKLGSGFPPVQSATELWRSVKIWFDQSSEPADTSRIWAPEAVAEPIWADDAPVAIEPNSPGSIWADEGESESVWSAETNPVIRTPLWFKIALGFVLSSPVWLSLWSRVQPPR